MSEIKNSDTEQALEQIRKEVPHNQIYEFAKAVDNAKFEDRDREIAIKAGAIESRRKNMIALEEIPRLKGELAAAINAKNTALQELRKAFVFNRRLAKKKPTPPKRRPMG